MTAPLPTTAALAWTETDRDFIGTDFHRTAMRGAA